MKPIEKALELISKFNFSYDGESKNYILYQNIDESKRCALIAVDEILNSRPSITESQVEYQNFWQEVKNEIEEL